MPNQAGTIEQLILAIGRALAPLQQKLEPANVLSFFAELGGVQFPPALVAQPAFSQALSNASAAAGSLATITTDLATAITADNTGAIVAKGAELVSRVI